ncbi:MAG: hypothetical protein Tsb002_10580 [Wenzhouxiangellaceae bacterium]
MILNRLTNLILIALLIAILALLISGHSILNILLPGGLPVGNLLAALFLLFLALLAMNLSQHGSIPRVLSVAAAVVALAWLPVSIYLAGNLHLNFNGVQGEIWSWYSIGTVLLSLVALAWVVGESVLKWLRNN